MYVSCHSQGDRCHVHQFSDLPRDYLAFMDRVLSRLSQKYSNNPLPLFLLGHSMGGLIASQVAAAWSPNSLTNLSNQQHSNSNQEIFPPKSYPPLDPARWKLRGLILSASAFHIDPALVTPLKYWAGITLITLVTLVLSRDSVKLLSW